MTLPGATGLGRSALSAVGRARTPATAWRRLWHRAARGIDWRLDPSQMTGASPRVQLRGCAHHHVCPGFDRGLGVHGRVAPGILGLCSLSVGSACKSAVEGPRLGCIAAAGRFPSSAGL